MTVLAAVTTAVAMLMTGAMAGLFFFCSVALMPGLDAIKPASAIEAMQSVNRKILNPVFLATFTGAPLVGALAGVALLLADQGRAALLFFAAAVVYVLVTFLPTAVVNVPMNNALEAAEIPSDRAEAARVWAGYSPRWTSWNHLRGVGGFISLLVMALGLYVWGSNA